MKQIKNSKKVLLTEEFSVMVKALISAKVNVLEISSRSLSDPYELYKRHLHLHFFTHLEKNFDKAAKGYEAILKELVLDR